MRARGLYVKSHFGENAGTGSGWGREIGRAPESATVFGAMASAYARRFPALPSNVPSKREQRVE